MPGGRVKVSSFTRPLFVCLAIALACPAVASPGMAAAVTISSEIGSHLFTSTINWQATRRIYVVAHMTLPADVERIWEVLTDYDNLEEFMPHLEKSEVLYRNSGRLMLRQEGSVWFPMRKLRTAATMEVRESPPELISFKATEGDYVVYEGEWRLEPRPEGTDLFYEAVIEPSFWVPRWMLSALERKILKGTFEAVLSRASDLKQARLAQSHRT